VDQEIKNTKQLCNARFLCPDSVDSKMARAFEQSCKAREMWFENPRSYPKVPMKLITKYQKEIAVGKDCLSLTNDSNYDISPFYPLLTFP